MLEITNAIIAHRLRLRKAALIKSVLNFMARRLPRHVLRYYFISAVR